MSSPQPPASGPRGWFPPALIVAAVVLVLAPGVHGDWGRDDYFQLAFARLVGSPWSLFTHDHFAPAPGSVFRPLGYASMWLGVRLFGVDYAAHAWSDITLHATVSVALFTLLRTLRVAALPSLLATLAFALHPAASGAALWWSARFDLLATLFVLVALVAAVKHRDTGGRTSLIVALLAVLAAMLSKEIGLVGAAAMAALWLQRAIVGPAERRRGLQACAAVAICASIYLAWRASVLGTASSGLTGALPLADAFRAGVGAWLQQAPAYFTFWPRLGIGARVVLAALALLAVSTWRMRVRGRGDGAVVSSGLALLVLPALLQAPVAALNAHPLDAGESAIEAAMQSRLYYLGIVGAAMLFAAVLDRAWRTHSRIPGSLLAIASAGVLVAFGAAAHRDAREFAERSVRNAAVAHAAIAAIDTTVLPQAPCHVVFMGLEPAPEWGVFVSMDSVVKALDADLARVAPCWFHANYPTWFFLMPAPVDASAASPYQPLHTDGRDVPWLRVGDAVAAYLEAPPELDADARARMRYLRWNGTRFEQVDAAVAVRERAGSSP